jgi:ABC-type multidrug transport system ATPase subunit
MAEPILVVEDLEKSYGDNHAVRGVSFRVARSEIFGLRYDVDRAGAM